MPGRLAGTQRVPPKGVSLVSPLQNSMSWESTFPLLALASLEVIISEVQSASGWEGTVASFLTLPSPGVTQKWLVTHGIVLTHRASLFP